MNEHQGRTPPDDPWSITLTYRHDQRWWSGANEEPESWHVSADVFDDSGMHVKSHVGDMTIVVIDVYQTRDPFGLLDGEDADLGAIAGTIFDARTGQLDPDLDDLLEPHGRPDPHPQLRAAHSRVARLRPRRPARRDSDQEAVRRRPGRGLLSRPDRRAE